jgi:hypothetical protein
MTKMGFLRILFWGILIYLAYRAVRQVFFKVSDEPQVKGKSKQKPLDIDKSQIEDADFEELND